MYTDSQTVPTLQPCHRWYDHPSRKSERTDKYTPEAKWQQQGVVYKVSIQLLTYIPTMNKIIWNEKHNTTYVKISQNKILRYEFTKCVK